MDAIIANIVRLRACQAAVLALFAAIIVTNVDTSSLMVGNEPTRTTRYPYVTFTGHAVANVTSPPALIPSTWSTDPVEAPLYETKTVFRDSPSLIFFPLPVTTTPCSSCDSTGSEDQNDGFNTTHEPLPEQHWVLNSIRGIFTELKERVLTMAAENLHSIELGLASFTMAKDRKIYQLEHQFGELANMTNWVIDQVEAGAAEIAQLRSIAEGRKQALTKQQWGCEKKLEKAAEDTARSLQEMDSQLELEKEKASRASQEELEKAAEDTVRSLNDMESKLEMEKEKASKAVQKAKDDGIREARHLTNLAIEQRAEAAKRRKADEATINALQNQSAADTNTIRQLSNRLNSIAETDEKVASLVAKSETLTKKVKDLRQEQERIVKSGNDAEATLMATIGKLNAKLGLADKRCQAAEAKASYQEALVVQAREEQRLAEERAGKLEAQVAKVEARKQAVEGEASREKARMEAKKAREAWQAQRELKKLYQQDPTCSEVPTPSSDLSSQESSMLAHPQPAVRLSNSLAGQRDVCTAQNELVPWYDRPAKTKGKTPPEERGLPANTPTGPKAERWRGRN